jgi:asparagine synthase (glutamine-hydrolysing)
MLSPVSQGVLEDHLTYLPVERLQTLERLVEQIERHRIPGDVVECGIALGGSAIVLATLSGRAFHGYDVFGIIPPPSDSDPPAVHERYQTIVSGNSKGIAGDEYYGYIDDLYARVTASFAKHSVPVDGERVQLHRGPFEETLQPAAPVAMGHIDCDWHDAVQLCLERLWPVLSPGGYLVLDDYNDYGGCREATDAFVRGHEDVEILQREPHAVITKLA